MANRHTIRNSVAVVVTAAGLATVMLLNTPDERDDLREQTAPTVTSATHAPVAAPVPPPVVESEAPAPFVPPVALAALPPVSKSVRRAALAEVELPHKKIAFVFTNIPDQPVDNGTTRCSPWCDARAGDTATFVMKRNGITRATAQVRLTGPPNGFRVVVIMPDPANVWLEAYMTRGRWNGTGPMPEWAARINASGVTMIPGQTGEAAGARVWSNRLDGEL